MPDLLRLARKPDSHKGQNGKVLIVGGSREYVGAPALAGLAALRAGCDLVNIAAPEVIAFLINAFSPDLITTKLKGDFISGRHFKELARKSADYDAVLVGNGVALQDFTGLVQKIEVPVVIDAGGFYHLDLKKINHCVLTPHRGEFAGLLKTSKLTEETVQAALRDNLLLIKGMRDTVLSATQLEHVEGGNPGLTVGGTGDVLAGVVASLIAQGGDPWRSALTASYAVKKAGDLCLAEKGFGFTAGDVIEKIPAVLKDFLGIAA